MTVRAVAFDIGGVLEQVQPASQWLGKWQRRLGMSVMEIAAAIGQADPDDVIKIGGLSEAEYGRRYAANLELTPEQSEAFMADMWDWYCGDLDTELTSFVGDLRHEYLTAVISNSADGARREDQVRYSLQDMFDLMLYSHEVGLAKPDPRIYVMLCDRLKLSPAEVLFIDDVMENVEAARDVGMVGVLHQSTAASIKNICGALAS